jgi:hypothetical protein
MEEEASTHNGDIPAVAAEELDDDPIFDEPSQPLVKEEAAKVSAPKEVVAIEPQTPPPAAKVVVESGPRRPGQGSGLSFSRPPEGEPRRDDRPKTEAPKAETKPQNQERYGNANGANESRRDGRDNRQSGQGNQRPQEHNQRRGDDRGRQDNNRRQDAPRHDTHRNEGNRSDNQGRRNDQVRNDQPRHDKPSAPPIASGSARNGRLFGWLVSFTDSNGKAIELREGRFFISGKSIKESDLVIDDRSVSAPHSLVAISRADGMSVQDLMSERGVFVRRGSSGQYQREEGTTNVGHGDWVRFGDVEFLISLLPGEE